MQSQETLGEKKIAELNRYTFDNDVNVNMVSVHILRSLVVFLENYSDETDFSEEVMAFGDKSIGSSVDSHKEYAMIGIACMKLFIQANWTGPLLAIESLAPFAEINISESLNKKCISILESNGNEMYQLICHPTLLCIAYIIFIHWAKKLHLISNIPLWSVKCLSVYCHVVEEVTEQEMKLFQRILEQVEDCSGWKEMSKSVLAEFHMCCFHLHMNFYSYTKAKECLEYLKESLHIDISLTASLGKRTKFQKKDLPQMKLEVKMGKERDSIQSKCEITAKNLPTDVELDNDTLLPHIEFIDDMKKVDLTPLDQAYIICNCIFIQKTHPRDKLTHEQLLPYTDSVLHTPQLWAVQHKALFLRSLTEMFYRRKIERAMSQLESLVSTFDKTSPEPSWRYHYAQAVDLQPQWVTEKEHAQSRFANGYVDTALEIFLRLQLWDDVISCYQRLGKQGKAEEVIRKQLDIRESATLWCLLGDVTLDKQYYEKAWEFSRHRNSRSQRSLGQWHLRRKEYEEAIPYYQKSLEINSLQPGIAFSLGCSCMFTNKIQDAVKALQACVSLDPENHEAWNNLASTFLRLGQIKKGYKALQESARLSYNNWRIWENFLLVATDIGAFEDSITCCHRLVDLRRKQIDAEVLHILVKATIDEELDHNGISAARLKPKLFKLFGHITSQITSNPNIWEIYAQLCLSNNDAVSDEKALHNLYKSHRCYTQNSEWEKDENEIKNVMRVTKQMMEVTKTVCAHDECKGRTLSIYSTTKMAISNLVIRLNKAFTTNNGPLPPHIHFHAAELESNIKEIQYLIESSRL